MEVFVKSFATWRTLKQATALSYDLVVDSLDKDTSTLTAVGSAITPGDAGNWLIADGRIYLIYRVKPQEGETVVTLLSPLDAFSRKIFFAEPAEGATIGGYVAGMLRDNWINCVDPLYALPYLTVSDSDTAPFVSPEVDSAGLFDLASYCRLMRRVYGVTLQLRDAGSKLACTIGVSPKGSRQIPFGDGYSQLKSVNYASAGTAKITAMQDGVASDWYLSENGEISRDIPARRAVGDWTTISVASNADVLEKVAQTFAKARSGHKVEFYSERDLDVLDNCRFLINGEVLPSYISCKRVSNSDNRFYYKAGELATTASEKLRGVKQ